MIAPIPAADETAKIAPHLLQREAECKETLCRVRLPAPCETLVSHHGDCHRIRVERRFHAFEPGREAASEIAVVFMVSSSGREVTARELPRCLDGGQRRHHKLR
jgi:hypothetical protein